MRRSILPIFLAVLTIAVFSTDAMAIYHPGLGRYVQRDRLGYVDGMNQYEYVRSNPVRWNDPSGLCVPGESCITDGNPNQTSCCDGVMYNPNNYCCKNKVLVARTRDDFGRYCCKDEIQTITRQVDNSGLYGHCWLDYPNPDPNAPLIMGTLRPGFYPVPDVSLLQVLNTYPGRCVDAGARQPTSSYTYRACPESVQALHDSAQKNQNNDYCAARYNCFDWADDRIFDAGIPGWWSPLPDPNNPGGWIYER